MLTGHQCNDAVPPSGPQMFEYSLHSFVPPWIRQFVFPNRLYRRLFERCFQNLPFLVQGGYSFFFPSQRSVPSFFFLSILIDFERFFFLCDPFAAVLFPFSSFSPRVFFRVKLTAALCFCKLGGGHLPSSCFIPGTLCPSIRLSCPSFSVQDFPPKCRFFFSLAFPT